MMESDLCPSKARIALTDEQLRMPFEQLKLQLRQHISAGNGKAGSEKKRKETGGNKGKGTWLTL